MFRRPSAEEEKDLSHSRGHYQVASSRHHTAYAEPTPGAADRAPDPADAPHHDPKPTIAELERREALWTAAARAVSHDLRIPLTTIIAALQTMARLGPEIAEDDPTEGKRVSDQLNRIWRKYTGDDGEYGLRDASVNESRILFELTVDKIATFGVPPS